MVSVVPATIAPFGCGECPTERLYLALLGD
jgi:hypothetical protein